VFILSALKKRLRGPARKDSKPHFRNDDTTHGADAPVTPEPTPSKPKWQKRVDRHMAALELVPDDALPGIETLYFDALHAPYAQRQEEREALLHELFGDFARLDTKFADLRPLIPASPLERDFYRKEIDHDDHPPGRI